MHTKEDGKLKLMAGKKVLLLEDAHSIEPEQDKVLIWEELTLPVIVHGLPAYVEPTLIELEWLEPDSMQEEVGLDVVPQLTDTELE